MQRSGKGEADALNGLFGQAAGVQQPRQGGVNGAPNDEGQEDAADTFGEDAAKALARRQEEGTGEHHEERHARADEGAVDFAPDAFAGGAKGGQGVAGVAEADH